MKNLNSFKFIAVILFSALLVLQSCKKEEEEEMGVAPELPPSSAFITDFSDFKQNSKDFRGTNWAFSAINVGVWNVIITVGLAVPVASYAEAVKNHTPVYQGDKTWLWTYDFLDNYTAELYGTITADGVNWEMYISKAGSFQKFLWYKGQSNTALTQGSWTLYDNHNSAKENLLIEWNKNADGTGNITYTNIIPGGAENGGYISYGNDNTDSEFATFYHIYNKGKDNLTTIEWSKDNKNGRVKDNKHFGDSDWNCWNTELANIDCN